MHCPLVSAILTFADPRRLNLARKAVNQFIQQHYTPYELIIVNTTKIKVLNNETMNTDEMRQAGCSVREIEAEAGLNAAAMKNVGIRNCSGSWVICIDDDDYFHPSRLMYQMAHRREGRGCMLKHQLRVDISSVLFPDEPNTSTYIQPLLHLLTQSSGIPCTLLFPRNDLWVFDEQLNTGEYDELVARMQATSGEHPVVCDNMHTAFVRDLAWPLLSIAFYHGNNELTHTQFFPAGTSSEAGKVPVGLNSNDLEYLKYVFSLYNFSVQS